MKKLLLFCSALILNTFSFGQTTVTFTPAKDNSIFSDQTNNSNATGPLFSGNTCFTAQRRALMQFDLSSIPPGSVITNVTLELDCNLVSLSGSGTPDDYNLYAVTQDWGEGTSNNSLGLGAAATPTDATWLSSSFPATNWTTPGGDFAPIALSTFSMPLATGTYTFPTAPNLVMAVQNWVDVPANNFGIIMIGNETANCTARRFGSKDNGTAPVLSVTYTPACTPVNSTDVQTACDTYDWIDGNTYTTSNNTATHTIVGGAANGCDSIITLNLTINNSSSSTDTQSACDNYTWIDGNTYTTSNNTATWTIPNAAGCDSLITLDLTINNSTSGTDVQSACDSYTWIDGNTYTASNNSATHVLTNAAGCDSTVTLNLTITNSSTSTDSHTECDSLVWIDGNTYYASNNAATHIIPNSVGCDSVITLDLTILNTTATFVQLTPVQDNSIYSENSNSNGVGRLYTGRTNSGNLRRSLIKFDMSSIPAGAIITNASLELTVDQFSGSTTNDYEIHMVTTEWGEGTSTGGGAGGAAVAPDATWSDAMFGTVAWTTAGGDFVATPSASTTFASTIGTETFTSTPMVSDIENWINNPANNFGWILIGEENFNQTTRRMGSKDQGVAPVLHIGYILPTSPDTTAVASCDSYTTQGGVIVTTSGIYQETLTSSSGCDSIAVYDVTINTVDASVTANDPSISANTTGASYQWLDCDNNFDAIMGETAQQFTAGVNGNYAVEVTENGCSDTSMCVSIISVSLDQLFDSNEINVFPNPTTDLINIDLGKVHPTIDVQVTNLVGEVVSSNQFIETDSLKLNLPEANGVYHITLIIEGRSITLTAIKE